MTGIIRDLSPTHILMVAGFLRHEVRRMIVVSVGVPNAQLGMLAVGVGFVGSGAVEAQVGVFDRQRPFQTESRNGRGFLSFTRIVDAQVQLAGGVCHIRDGDVRALRSGELVLVYGFQRIVIDLFDGVVDALGVTACARPTARGRNRGLHRDRCRSARGTW